MWTGGDGSCTLISPKRQPLRKNKQRKQIKMITNQQSEAGMLADENAIISAIKRSISHNEIVNIPDASPMMTVDWIADLYDEVDSASEPDGSRDVWGKRDGEDFRIKLVKK
jgi:hypothetical protein